MHSAETVNAVLDLAGQGQSATQIARTTGLSRSTIRGWLADAVPHSARASRHGCERCGGFAHEVAAVAAEYAYLLGIYLGDGCIAAHPRGVFKLRLSLDAKYPGILDEVCGAIAAVVPTSKVSRVACAGGGFENSVAGSNIEVYSYSKAWPCLFPQHGAGRKHERKIALEEWQERIVAEHPRRLLRGLIHSDGCRGMNTGRGNWRHPRYSFSNRSDDIRAIFIAACDELGLRWTTAPDKVYVSRIADVARLDEFIGPKS